MKLAKIIGMALLVSAGSVLAADTDEPTTVGPSKASAWIGKDVKDNAGNDVGELKDLVINWKEGRVAYAIVAVENWMGLNKKVVPMELKNLSVSPDGDDVIVKMTEAQVKALRPLNEGALPATAAASTNMMHGANKQNQMQNASDQMERASKKMDKASDQMDNAADNAGNTQND